jgi:hypothetical protein
LVLNHLHALGKIEAFNACQIYVAMENNFGVLSTGIAHDIISENIPNVHILASKSGKIGFTTTRELISTYAIFGHDVLRNGKFRILENGISGNSFTTPMGESFSKTLELLQTSMRRFKSIESVPTALPVIDIGGELCLTLMMCIYWI